MTSLGKRVFADVINYSKMRSHWSTVGSKSSMTSILIRRGEETDRHKEKTAVRTKAKNNTLCAMQTHQVTMETQRRRPRENRHGEDGCLGALEVSVSPRVRRDSRDSEGHDKVADVHCLSSVLSAQWSHPFIHLFCFLSNNQQYKVNWAKRGKGQQIRLTFQNST